MINTFLAQVHEGLGQASDEGYDSGYMEGYEAGAWAMREYIMGNSTENPYDKLGHMRQDFNDLYGEEA